MEKQLNKITNILNTYLEKFDCVISSSNTIHYALVTAETHKDSFLKFVNTLFPEINADIFLWSFFHEIGHHETEDDFTEEEEEEYRIIASSNISNEEYYNLPMEYAATDWAGEYMKEHSAEVAQLWNKLAPVIRETYKLMEVE